MGIAHSRSWPNKNGAASSAESNYLWRLGVLISCVCFFSSLSPPLEKTLLFLPSNRSHCWKDGSLGSCLWLASTGHELRVQLGAPCATDHTLWLKCCNCSLSPSPCSLCMRCFFVNVLQLSSRILRICLEAQLSRQIVLLR